MENTNNPIESKFQDFNARRKERLERLAELSKVAGLPAGNYSPRNKPEPLPVPGTNWDLWAHMPKATLPEAVALSLGIDPSAIEPRSGYAEPGKMFDDRLKLACAYVSEAGPLRPIKELGRLFVWGKPEEATVSLPEFAQWALSMGWKLPDKFLRLKAAPTQPATNSTVPVTTATQNPLYVAIQQIVKSELQKHTPAPVVPTEPPATTPSPAPVEVETTEQRRARWLDWYGKGERGAVQRVYERELLLNPKADRSFIGKEIDKAKNEKAETKRGGAMFGQLVKDGTRMG